MKLTKDEIRKYKDLPNSVKDTITSLIIKESMTEQESYKMLVGFLRRL